MYELFGSVNPRITDDLFGILYPAGFMSLIINASLTGLCLLVYSLTFWLVRDHFSVDTRSRRDLALEIVVIAALGCSFALFPIVYAAHLLTRCFFYVSLANKAIKARKMGAENASVVKGRLWAVRIKLGLLGVFLPVLAAAFGVLPYALSFLFPGWIEIYYYTLYSVGVAIVIVLNVVKKPHGLPSFLAPWRPSLRVKRAVQVAVVAFPVLCGTVILSSGVIKYHAPAPAAPTSAVTSSMRVVTYNIRNGAAHEVNPANDWVNRKDEFGAYVASLDPDIMGVQEAFHNQLEDIKASLNALKGPSSRAYKYTGFGREDGVHGGEHAAIFFDANLFTFVDGDTFWLSPTPDCPSKQWDTSNYRVCTWTRLERVATGAQFVVFCTHYATGNHYYSFHENASALIKERMPSYAGGLPVFLMGDLNMFNTTHSFDMLLHEGANALADTYTGPLTYTFTEDFDVTKHPTGNNKIDFILVNDLVTVTSCTIPRDWYGANQTYSDHYPVVVDCNV